MAPFLYCTADKFEIQESTPWIELCFAVFGGDFSTKSSIIERLPTVGAYLQKTLTYDEVQALVEKFRIDYHPEATTMGATSTSDNVQSQKQQDRVLKKAIRKLRHPSRAKFLRGSVDITHFESRNWDESYYNKIEALLKSELQKVFENAEQPNVYISNILNKNQISITFRGLEILKSHSLEEFGLSVRSLNCLKRAGITSLGDIAKIKEDSMLYGEIGRIAAEKIEKALQQYKSQDEFATVEVVYSGEKTIYKFVTDDLEKIAESIYVNELQRNNPESTILHGPFSPGLTEIFLMLGYFYRDDVFQDADSLCNRFQLMGFPAFAEELSKISQISRIIGESDSEDVLVFPAPYVKLAQENGCTNLADFKTVLEKNGHDVEYISRLFDV